MNSNQLEITARIQIQKSANDVFEGIVNPEKMSNYFISKGSGRMEEGVSLTWHFPEFQGGFQVKVGKIIRNELITFLWDSNDQKTEVTIELTPKAINNTLVTVTEKSHRILYLHIRPLNGDWNHEIYRGRCRRGKYN